MLEVQYFETGRKENSILRKNDCKVYNSNFWNVLENIYFETLYAQKYSQKKSSRSNLDRPARIWHLFYMKKAPSYTFYIFYVYNASINFLYFTHTIKFKKILFSVHTFLYLGDMFLNDVSLISAKKQKSLILKWILFFCSPVKLDLPN